MTCVAIAAITVAAVFLKVASTRSIELRVTRALLAQRIYAEEVRDAE